MYKYVVYVCMANNQVNYPSLISYSCAIPFCPSASSIPPEIMDDLALSLKDIIRRIVNYTPFCLLASLNIVWTCNIGPNFFDNSDEDADSLVPQQMGRKEEGEVCTENFKITIAISLQLASFVAIFLAMTALLGAANFGVKIRSKSLRMVELILLLLLFFVHLASLAFFLFHALTAPVEGEGRAN